MRAPWLIALTLALGACSSVPEGSRPAPLPTVTKEVDVKAAWSRSIGPWEDAPQGELRPVVADGVLYLVDGNNVLRAYDARKGRFLWQRRLSGDVSGGITAAGETLLFGTRHGEVLALSQKDGAPVWRAQVSSEVLTPPAVSEGVVVVRAGDGKLYGLEQHDGARRWVVDRPVPALTLRGIGAPVIADGVVYAGFANGKLLAVALRDGSVQWEATVATPQGRSELERMVDVDARPIVADDVVYAVAYQGRVVALARSSGRVLWSRDMSSHTDMSYDAGSLYVRDENGDVWALDRRSGAALWKQDKLHNRASSAPVIFGSDLVVADIEGYLHWLARNDGRLLARHHVGDAGMVGAPVVTDDLLYAIGADGSVFALRAHQR